MPPLKKEVAKIYKFSPEGLSPQIKLNFMCRKDSAENQSLSHIAYIKYACASPLCKGAMKQQRCSTHSESINWCTDVFSRH